MRTTTLRDIHGWLLLMPAAILLIAFTHYPTVATVIGRGSGVVYQLRMLRRGRGRVAVTRLFDALERIDAGGDVPIEHGVDVVSVADEVDRQVRAAGLVEALAGQRQFHAG